MTPKEKAKELINNYNFLNYKTDLSIHEKKQCALIAVDLRLDGDFIFTSIEYGVDSLEYWQEIKQEILKL
jgi:hypothetical protein